MKVRLTVSKRMYGNRGEVIVVNEELGNALCTHGVADVVTFDAPLPPKKCVLVDKGDFYDEPERDDSDSE